MTDPSFHLVFRGEVLEGQDPAAVAERLATLLKMDPARAGALFSGKPVVLKRAVPKAVAAKYQAAFKKAGARLRAMPAEATAADASAPARTEPPAVPAGTPAKKPSHAERLAAAEATQAAAPAKGAAPGVEASGHPAAAGVPDDAPGATAFSLAPATGDLVAEDERPQVAPVVVDVSHLSAAPPGTGSLEDVLEPLPPPPVPDVSGLSLAEAGADIGPARDEVVAEVVVPDIGIAEAGAEIETLASPPPLAVPDVDFGVAAVGADLDPQTRPPPPPPPDVSHIRLATEVRDRRLSVLLRRLSPRRYGARRPLVPCGPMRSAGIRAWRPVPSAPQRRGRARSACGPGCRASRR